MKEAVNVIFDRHSHLSALGTKSLLLAWSKDLIS
jgi:hypothetical protein